jgi:NADH:ubiquinone oxidoreductase subunit 5 (subunit L)/multisubunit Na+/H+ antiporter MnhA subunit
MFLIGVLAISGVGYAGIGLSGYYSKDLILAHAGAFADLAIHLGHSRAYLLLFTIPVVVAYLTPFYMMRCWMMTFWGKPRQPQLYDNAREMPVMWGPLVVLAILAALSGRVMSIRELLEGSLLENNTYCRQFDPAFAGFDTVWVEPVTDDKSASVDVQSVAQVSLDTGHHMVDRRMGPWGFSIGLLLAILVYARGLGLASFFLKIPPWRWIRNWLYERMYFDELYFGVFVASVSFAAEVIGWFDDVVLDNIVNGAATIVRKSAVVIGAIDDRWVDGAVTGTASFAGQMGDAARAPQTGRIRGYVTVLLATAAIVIAVAVIVALSK